MTARGTAGKVRIAQWLKRHGLAQYARAFKEHNIGFDVLPRLGDEDLKELGVPLGDRKRLLKAIADRQMSLESAGDAMTSAAARGPPICRIDPERRQLTLLFCDLVASTELSARLDPEDLREVVHAYQVCVAAVVTRFEGHVAKYMGDGVLAYFGFPGAHEDDPERAVRAGLELVHAVAKLRIRPDVELEARVGIATGEVIVGGLVGEGSANEHAAIGATPNLVVRLQALGEPGSVIINRRTRRLVGDLFEVASLGAQAVPDLLRDVQLVASLSVARTSRPKSLQRRVASVRPLATRGPGIGWSDVSHKGSLQYEPGERWGGPIRRREFGRNPPGRASQTVGDRDAQRTEQTLISFRVLGRSRYRPSRRRDFAHHHICPWNT